jgi:hypothetical protein
MRILMITMSLMSFIGCSSVSSGHIHSKTGHEDFAVEKVADGIYVHHGKHLDIDTGYQGDICNISFIVGNRGVAVIDTGGSLKVGAQLR